MPSQPELMWALALLLLVFLSGRSLRPTLRSAAFCEHFSDCAVTGTNGSPHQHHGRERALPDHWDHLWLLSLRPSVNPYQVANELGYQNLGEVVAFPGHFVFRSRQKARCRQLFSLALILDGPRKEKGCIDFFSLHTSHLSSFSFSTAHDYPSKASFTAWSTVHGVLCRSKYTASLFLITL